MKTISTGGKILGVIDLLFGIVLIIIFFVSSQDVRMDRLFDDPKTTLPVFCLIAGSFKLLGVITILLKQKIGVGFYFIGSLALIFFFFYVSTDFEFSESDEMLPILILYTGIALQFWFIYIMSKAIKA